ncbi:MAG TPA: tetratricopeptide repeat protein [Leptolyngbyaceae cyanobacterium M33_DOE_097]|uniref:Tetratricopeptide repeat protein n=1 Tax=Oscillatoriales cyanobacterium SpSt-418 TaxID=2282169 RepID=A0A7C3PJB4_9CYAN|nr:tetratricopeptide repeat protein [Leptolyngbyaceae cyanobacterium M33_DOE_097]
MKSLNLKIASLTLLATCLAWDGVVPTRFSFQSALAQTTQDKKAEGDLLLQKGLQQYDAGQYQAAIKTWQQALAQYRAINNRNGEAQVLTNLGLTYAVLEQYPKSIDYFEQALSVARAIGNRKIEAQALSNLGDLYSALSQLPKAIRYYEQALPIYRTVQNAYGEARVLNNLGTAYTALTQYDKAKGYFEQAGPIFRKIQERNSEADTLINLGISNVFLYQYDNAIASFERALSLYRAVQNRSGEENALVKLGNTYLALLQYPKAVGYFEQSLAIARTLKDPNREASGLNNLGIAYLSLAQYEKAIAYFEQALPLYRAAQNRRSEAGTLTNMGNAYSQLTQYTRAIDYYEQSLPIFRALQDRKGEAGSLNGLGNAYLFMSQYAKAIAYFEQALPVYQAVQEPDSEAIVLMNLGNAYNFLSQYAQAIRYFEQALPLYRTAKNRRGEADALGNLGISYNYLSQPMKAIRYFEQALPIYRAVQNPNREADALNNLGTAYYSLSQHPKAIAYFEQALSLYRTVKDRKGEAGALANLGGSYAALSQPAKAIASYKQALPIYQSLQNRDGESITLNNLGDTYFKMGELAQAEPLLRQSIQVRECIRVGLKDDQKISIFESQSDAYRTLQQVLVAQNKSTEALEIAERGRARAFVELLAQRLNSNSKPSANCTPVQPPTLAQIQQIAKQQNATLVEYSVIDRDRLLVWVVQPNGQIHFRSVDLTADLNGVSLAEWVKATRAEDLNVRGRGLGVFESDLTVDAEEKLDKANLQTLHQWLIEPIAELLPTTPDERIIFIPQGALFLVPFAALRDAAGKHLIEKHTIAVAPSIQTLALTRAQKTAEKRQKVGTTLIVGNPAMPKVVVEAGKDPVQLSPLPGAETEAQALAALLKTPALIGTQATEATIKAQMPQASLIHLATHGLLDDNFGINSSIALTPTRDEDGFLTAAEISNLSLQATLVVLSACDTGRGTITGDGVIGLSRSLISAGVPSVVVSLWAVPDAPTAFLMTEFYKNLETSNDKAKALRQAMLTTMQRYEKPRDWAAFTLIGES